MKQQQLKELIEQATILQQAEEDDAKLDSVLQSYGWGYDDLRYEDSYELSKDSPSEEYVTLESLKKPPHNVPMVSFFAGAGGLDLGFEAAGFSHDALVELNPIFCNTLRHNRPNWSVIGPPNWKGDVSDFENTCKALEECGVCVDYSGVFVGGPPCQPFSIAANQRFSKDGENFKRVGFAHEKNGNLLFDYINLIIKYKPAAFLVENVVGLIEVDDGVQLNRAIEMLSQNGYSIEKPLILNASDFLVPQHRTRMFLVGNRLGKSFLPPQKADKTVPCSAALCGDLSKLPNHVTRKHQTSSILRYVKLPFGGRDKLGRVDRLNPMLPSKTVIAGGSSGGGRSHLHPSIPRTLSVRESARLQTFPDDYEFTGTHSRQFTQVGNAVPPVLATQLAWQIYQSFFS
ncbi:DNA cytosine methyltransferase [Citrobacter sp. FDAARGOS_156]|uniref:DNA cytosine methyltransferase n=1 Tax=Citrobacter TaxID=544 RepID=UPI001905910A|nr:MULTISPECIES: DNA cytosine methyltransferase [Citrobacter]MBJ9643633.1 DNA cytosine methyltransferase [Citrobacter sp. FDAARGOS_156]MDT7345897.1 DNA cytosine methyltransferase [Citrobacter freundii]HEF0014711.1 DNA cytosine methyltransferase [Citrobacter freundii]